MQASAPHRNIRLSHPSFNKYPAIAKKYPNIARNIQLSPIITSPLSQCFNNHHKDKGRTFLQFERTVPSVVVIE